MGSFDSARSLHCVRSGRSTGSTGSVFEVGSMSSVAGWDCGVSETR